MNAALPRRFTDLGECVDATVDRVGTQIVMGLPVGIGKPNPLVNAFVQRALRDERIHLKILTGLSLRTPRWHGELERRFLQPFVARVFGDYPDLEYIKLLERGKLPRNIEVGEFFLEPGAWLNNAHLQQHYLSSNYTHVVRDGLQRGMNVLAQLVAPAPAGENSAEQLSLSCNPDLTADLLPHIAAERAKGRRFAFIGQMHPELPYMYGDAIVPAEYFDFLIDNRAYDYPLFAPPNLPIGTAQYLIAMHVSALIKDGGTLQVGIGELGDAVVYALQLRHERPALFREALDELGIRGRYASLIEREGGTQPFDRGLYGCTEMLADGFLDLYRAGILKRRVYPSVRIQALLDAGAIEETVDVSTLEALVNAGVNRISYVDFHELRDVGVFRDDVRYENGVLIAGDGTRITVKLHDPECRLAIEKNCLGTRLRNGVVLDGGFFFGPRGFYKGLRELPAIERKLFAMRSISFINELYGPEFELKITQRRNARFVNSTMMVTGLGAAVSDALEDGRVVSGVGGQYNFVAMAHALAGARSILCLPSTRTARGTTMSNIVWSYAHITIPRHLRDIFVTEYGIADLRSCSDAEIAAKLVDVMDARFHESFVAEAKRAGKLPQAFRVPDAARSNLPATLEGKLQPWRQRGMFVPLPYGTDFTEEEIVLMSALKALKSQTSWGGGKAAAALRTLLPAPVTPLVRPYLQRMQLDHPQSLQEKLLQKMLINALNKTMDKV